MRHTVVTHLQLHAGDLAEEIRHLFEDLDRALPRTAGSAGETSPALDVVETEEAVEIIVEVPGIAGASLRVALFQGVLVVAGDKRPAPVTDDHDAVFHLVERGFGRFARAIHLSSAVDGSRAEAGLKDGELRVRIPKIAERRGRELRIPIKDQT